MSALAALFQRHLPRAVVDAVLEGRLGAVTMDDPESPTVARVSIGCYEMIGGDPAHPLARDLVAGARPHREIVYGNDPTLRRLVLDVFGPRVADRPMEIFDASHLDPDALRQIASSCPEGYAVRRMDEGLARQLDDELRPHALQVFASPEHFAREGLGYAALAPDGTLACAATSYTVASRMLEVAISTRVAHRGHGLAAVTSAALMAESMDRGMVPQWSASNPVSKRLAQRLGYRPGPRCEVLYLD